MKSHFFFYLLSFNYFFLTKTYWLWIFYNNIFTSLGSQIHDQITVKITTLFRMPINSKHALWKLIKNMNYLPYSVQIQLFLTLISFLLSTVALLSAALDLGKRGHILIREKYLSMKKREIKEYFDLVLIQTTSNISIKNLISQVSKLSINRVGPPCSTMENEIKLT